MEEHNKYLEMKEMENYEWRVRARVKNLKYRRDKINGKILERNLDIILNHDLSKKDLFLKEIDEMWKESNDLDSHINALEKKEIEFPPILKFKSESKVKSKAKAKAKPKPVVSVNPAQIIVPTDRDYEIENGLLGVKRDLFNKLATHRCSDNHDLHQMFRISSGQIPWTRHFTFTMKRMQKPKPIPKSSLQPYGKKHFTL
jgi:hypothetical protein